jgi:hypothetical protein
LGQHKWTELCIQGYTNLRLHISKWAMSETQDKLEESKYFLARARENVYDPTQFRFNLSALLSAGRSVTWVMMKEFSGHEGFGNW